MKRNKRQTKLSLALQRLKKHHNCRECTVEVTRMDFQRILGKFTRVKIQYENYPKRKVKVPKAVVSPSKNSRLKSNENGMVLLHRSAYNQHPVQDSNPLKKKAKVNNSSKPILVNTNGSRTYQSKNKLADLMEYVDENILPNSDWCIDVFPISENHKDDVVYNKIAAELENLMSNEKGKLQSSPKTDKADDLSSILDILNDNTSATVSPAKNNSGAELPSHYDTNDIEAMLLDSKPSSKTHLTNEPCTPAPALNHDIEEPGSPSILHETVPDSEAKKVLEFPEINQQCSKEIKSNSTEGIKEGPSKTRSKPVNVTHVVFKKMHAGICQRNVKLLKTLKYAVELQSKPIELLAAPKFVSNIFDIKTLLQIVDECNLDSSFVWDKSVSNEC